MRKELSFGYPFSGFASTTFINCFASVYMFLEGIPLPASDYDCKRLRGEACDSCGNCQGGGDTPLTVQEQYFFLFDTVSGRSSLRCRFDGEPTAPQRRVCASDFYDAGADETVDFLFGYAGYAYDKLTNPAEFRGAVAASIDAGRPLIAKARADEGRFHVIVGCDGDKLLSPDYANAQRPPAEPPAYDGLEALYRVGGKVRPRYTFKDGLRRVVEIMEYNAAEGLWDAYIEKMGLYTADSFDRADLGEKKARMKRVADTMWHTFNCHNFAEVFRRRRVDELRAPALDGLCAAIGGPCHGYTHDLAWALIGLEERADWTKHHARYFGEMAQLTLRQIADNDARALEAVKAIIELIHTDL